MSQSHVLNMRQLRQNRDFVSDIRDFVTFRPGNLFRTCDLHCVSSLDRISAHLQNGTNEMLRFIS